MKKIKTCIFKEDENLIYSNYYIFPYYNENTIVYITIKNNRITWFNNDLKLISPYKRINKSLLYFYNNSKFKGYEICIIGFINKIQNFHSIAVFDLLLIDEFNGNIQSKKYSIRYDNIKYRFLVNIPKSIKNIYAIFSQKYSKETFETTFLNCIKTNIWEGYSLYKDKPYCYDDKIDLITNKMWEFKNNKIKDINFTINEDHKIILKSIIIENNNLKIKINNGIEKIKINNIDDINDLKNKEIIYKICTINDIIYSKFISFKK